MLLLQNFDPTLVHSLRSCVGSCRDTFVVLALTIPVILLFMPLVVVALVLLVAGLPGDLEILENLEKPGKRQKCKI